MKIIKINNCEVIPFFIKLSISVMPNKMYCKKKLFFFFERKMRVSTTQFYIFIKDLSFRF